MQFRKTFKIAIRAGKVTRSFRHWQRPQATLGGKYNLHPEGAIEVTALAQVSLGELSDCDLDSTGITDLQALKALLGIAAPATRLYQVDFRYLGPDLVKQANTSAPATSELAAVITRLRAMDKRSDQPWTITLLQRLRQQPGTRAADLAPVFGWDTNRFKTQVRKLKALGLTVSLETGYQISPRGLALLQHLGD
jgi:hypothetical protein